MIFVHFTFGQCELDHIFQADSVSGFWWSCFGTVGNAFIYMLERSYVSLGGAALLAIVAIAFAPYKGSWKSRVTIGILHLSAHLTAALFLMLVLELGVEMLVRHKLLATSGTFYSQLFSGIYLKRNFSIVQVAGQLLGH